jgi:RHS repeat-associated protein
MASFRHPVCWPASYCGSTGGTLTYAYDAMGRPEKLTDDQATPIDWVKEVLYGAAGQMTQMKEWDTSTSSHRTRIYGYNANLQLSQLQIYGVTSQTYTHSTTQNNGRVTAANGVNYTYDSLNWLSTAVSGSTWGLSFTYDGFGNRTAQTVTVGSGPSSSLSVNAANNRVTSWDYDARGNVTWGPPAGGYAPSYSYDFENRLSSVNWATPELYAYGPDNQRVWKKQPDSTEFMYWYDLSGKQAGTYEVIVGQSSVTLNKVAGRMYFAGWLVTGAGPPEDRLGSYGTYYPYGEDRFSGPNNNLKFATYYRDETTGFDYAVNRYYLSGAARFLTADPYMASGGAAEPGSWNRYAYVEGDPINYYDPRRLQSVDVTAPYPDPVGYEYDLIADFLRYYLDGSYQASSGQQPPPPSEAQVARIGVPTVKSRALVALANPECEALFGTAEGRAGGVTPQAILNEMLSGPVVGPTRITVDFDYTGMGDARVLFRNIAEEQDFLRLGIQVSSIRVSIKATTWNTLNFPVNNPVNDRWGIAANAALLLHELGHVFDVVSGLGGSRIRTPDVTLTSGIRDSLWNKWLIDSTCFGGTLGFQKPPE